MGYRLANVDGRASLVIGSDYHDLEAASGGSLGCDPMAALTDLVRLRAVSESLRGRTPEGAVDAMTLGPPVPRPSKSFGIGLNYKSHAEEAAMEVGEHPLTFSKFPSCICGPTSEIELRSDGCDYEGELVVVIGPGGKDIAEADAWNHVAGLCVGQDISDRPMQFAANPPHFDLGKSFDTFGPIGPVLVSPDELTDPSDLRIVTEVNGEVRQDDTTRNMVFDVPALVAYLSRVTTLVAGDLMFTGTPEGIGASQGRFLADGDVVTTTIDGIGSLTNRCRRITSF